MDNLITTIPQQPDSYQVAKILISIALGAVVAAGCTGCGASVGSDAVGTAGFMQEHNKKLEILRENRASSGAPMDWYHGHEKRQLNRLVNK